MEASAFFLKSTRRVNDIKIISWNADGIHTEAEKENILQVLIQCEILCLLEVKTALPVMIPGYVTYRSAVVGAHDRGGAVVCVKACITHLVQSVDLSIRDQVWLTLQNSLFGFCYISPIDSSYFSNVSFSSIQERLCAGQGKYGCILMEDMNARFGESVRDLLTHMSTRCCKSLSYPSIADAVNVANSNADLLASLCCENNVLVINNLKTSCRHYIGNKTYRKKGTLISEIDTCVASSNMSRSITDLQVLQESGLPPDHPPISLTICCTGVNLNHVLRRAEDLLNCFVSDTHCKQSRRPVRFQNMNRQLFETVFAD